jgi:hypothetical protein
MKINNFFFFMIYKCSVLTSVKATIFRNSALASWIGNRLDEAIRQK